MPGRVIKNKSRSWSLRKRYQFDSLPREKEERIILHALQDTVSYCRKNVPYYQKVLQGFPIGFPRTFEEYRELPTMHKDIIRKHKDELISNKFEKSKLFKHSTGGSTGEPISIYLSTFEHGIRESAIEHHMRQIGGGIGARLGTLYGGHLDIKPEKSHLKDLKNWFLNTNAHGCFRMDEEYLLSVHKDFVKFQPDILICYASAIFLLARLLEKRHIKPNYPTKAILTAAEKFDDKQREIVERVFNVPAVERYGSRDMGLIAYQHIGDRRMWIDSWDCFVEPESQPDGMNSAPILITKLHSYAMPLLRYKIGDIAIFPNDFSNKHPTTFLEEVVGRTVSNIYLPNGDIVHGVFFPRIFREFDIVLFQLHQKENGSVNVFIVPGDNYIKKQKDKCEKIIRDTLKGLNVKFEYLDKIERTNQNKLMPVISNYGKK
jgi:phenylacetate-CoA ligase